MMFAKSFGLHGVTRYVFYMQTPEIEQDEPENLRKGGSELECRWFACSLH